MPINEVQSGRYNAILRKVMAMDVGAPSPSLATDLFPTIALEVDRPEWAFLGATKLAGLGVSAVAGGVGQYSQVGCYNPAGSGVLVVVKRLSLYVLSGSQYYIAPMVAATIAAIIASYNGLPRDRRDTGLAAGRVSVGYQNAAPSAYYQTLYVPAGDLQRELRCDFVLPPGTGVMVQALVDNWSSFIPSWEWYERVLEASETR